MTSASDVTVAVESDGVRVPMVHRANVPVASIVQAAHEETIASALTQWSAAGLTSDSLEQILVYCAEQQCKDDDATCPGCRLRVERAGLKSLDDFVAQFSQVIFETSGARIQGSGSGTYAASSLEHLAATWSGIEIWFWARRVLRKLRHGIRRAGQTGAPPLEGRESPAVILVRPQLADNIGMVARAMANFGLEHLRLVEPRDGWPNEKARIAASGANFIIDGAQAYSSFPRALEGLHWVCAATARQRDLAKPVVTPEQAVQEIRQRLANGQRCGVIFGPERNGLETGEIANADAVVMAPVNPNFASLNLAQAVLLLSYEWMKQAGAGTLGRVTTYEQPVQPGLRTRGSPPASREELMGLFEHLERELERAGFFSSPEKRPSVIQNLRSMFVRMGATEQEIRTLRGIVKALANPRR